jgi:hypothetical protein
MEVIRLEAYIKKSEDGISLELRHHSKHLDINFWDTTFYCSGNTGPAVDPKTGCGTIYNLYRLYKLLCWLLE